MDMSLYWDGVKWWSHWGRSRNRTLGVTTWFLGPVSIRTRS